MLRRLLILFFILANLTSQVSMAYSCAMMGEVPVMLKKCCCDPEERVSHCDKSMSGEKGCCDQVVDVADGPGDQAGNVAAPVKLPDFDPQVLPALLPVLLALVLPSQAHSVTWDVSRDHSLNGTDLYLRTQRLRL
nr:A379 [uncultured bacterium]